MSAKGRGHAGRASGRTSGRTSASVKCFLQSDFQLIASADDGRAAARSDVTAASQLEMVAGTVSDQRGRTSEEDLIFGLGRPVALEQRP